MSYRAECMCGSRARSDKAADVREWIAKHAGKCWMAAWKAVSLEAGK